MENTGKGNGKRGKCKGRGTKRAKPEEQTNKQAYKKIEENCPFCGKEIQRNNMASHLSRRHPKYSKDQAKSTLDMLSEKRKVQKQMRTQLAFDLLNVPNQQPPGRPVPDVPQPNHSHENVTAQDGSKEESKAADAPTPVLNSESISQTTDKHVPKISSLPIEGPVSKLQQMDMGIPAEAAKIFHDAKRDGSDLTQAERSNMPAQNYMKQLLDMLSPTQRVWFNESVFPWGYEQPTAAMIAFFVTLDKKNTQLHEQYRNLLEKLSEKKQKIKSLKKTLHIQSETLKTRVLVGDKMDQFFNKITTEDETWSALEKALNKVHTFYVGKGAFAGWASASVVDVATEGGGDETRGWMRKCGETALSHKYIGAANIRLHGEVRGLKNTLAKVEKEYEEFKNTCSKEVKDLFLEQQELKNEIKNSQSELTICNGKLNNAIEKLAEEKERVEFLRGENKTLLEEDSKKAREWERKYEKLKADFLYDDD